MIVNCLAQRNIWCLNWFKQTTGLMRIRHANQCATPLLFIYHYSKSTWKLKPSTCQRTISETLPASGKGEFINNNL